jgi:hypothetical protein
MAMNPMDDEAPLTFVQVITRFEQRLYAALWKEREASVARGDGALDGKDVARMITIATDMVLGELPEQLAAIGEDSGDQTPFRPLTLPLNDCTFAGRLELFLDMPELMVYFFVFDFEGSVFKGLKIELAANVQRIDFTFRRTSVEWDCGIYNLSHAAMGLRAQDLTVNGSFALTGNWTDVVMERATCGSFAVGRAALRSISLTESTIRRDLRFSFVTLQWDANFRQTKILQSATFHDVDFKTAPDFHEASLPSATGFINTTFSTEDPDPDRADSNFPAIDRFRALRVAMRKAGARHEEDQFFALELRARRSAGKFRRKEMGIGPIEVGLSWLYDKLSVYGTSVGRPILCFVLWNLTFALLFWLIVHAGPSVLARDVNVGFGYRLGVPACAGGLPKPCIAPIMSETAAMNGAEPSGLALQNALNPFAVFSGKPAFITGHFSVFLLSIIQGFGSLTIGALLLLSLKGKFQRSGGGGS